MEKSVFICFVCKNSDMKQASKKTVHPSNQPAWNFEVIRLRVKTFPARCACVLYFQNYLFTINSSIHSFIWVVIFLFVQLFSNYAITDKLTARLEYVWVCGKMKGNYVKPSPPNLEVYGQQLLRRAFWLWANQTAALTYTQCNAVYLLCLIILWPIRL